MARSFERNDVLQSLYSMTRPLAITYTSNRPSSIPDTVKEFIVIDLPGSILDETAYQDATLRIDIFKRDKSGSIEDVNGLDLLTKSVMGLFPIVNGILRATKPKIVAGGSDGYGFHYIIIYAKLLTN